MNYKKQILKIQKKFNGSIFQKFYENLYGFSLNGMGYGYGGGINLNGEEILLKKLSKKIKNGVIFDVGANKGDYSLILNQYFENVKIFAFEPVKKTYQKLKNNFNFSKNIFPINLGLGNKIEKKTIYFDNKISEIATLHNRKIKLQNKELINLETLDNFCKINEIKEIEFLKIDVEGNDLFVLEGAKEMIDKNKIKRIQFEFGIRNVDSKTFFIDFWDLLNEKYNFYRIFNKGIFPIKKYSEKLEIFTGMNYYLELKK